MRTLTLALALVVALPAVATEKYLGLAVTIEEATPIADILAAPAAWNGKEVRVEGTVSGVCQKMGCWMDLVDADGQEIKIKVEDGVIVFPKESAGGQAICQGTVSTREVSREDYVEWKSHFAEDRGETWDPSELGDGPYLMVQIQGAGAQLTLAD